MHAFNNGMVLPLGKVNQWHLTQLIVMHIINKTSVAASWALHIGISIIKIMYPNSVEMAHMLAILNFET